MVTGDGIDTWDVIDVIGSLVAKSMLSTDEAADSSTRYRLLETLRQYARDRLDDTDDPDVWRRRHAEHYTVFAEAAGAGLLGEDELMWRPRTLGELDNLRSAVMWSFDREGPDDPELAVRIVAGLSNEANSGRALEVGAWAERALPLVETATSEQRAPVLSAAAWNTLLAGNLDVARDRAHAVLREDISGFVQAIAYVQLSYSASILGGFDAAVTILEEGLTAIEADPPTDAHEAVLMKALLLTGYCGMALLALPQDPAPGSTRGAEALRLAKESRHPTSIANALFVVALERWRGDPQGAGELLDEAIALVHAGANSVIYPVMLAIRALLCGRVDDVVGACRALHEGIALGSDKGDLPALASALDYGIQALISFGEAETAVTIRGALTDWLSALSTNPRYEIAHRDEALHQARHQLGDADYEGAMAHGQRHVDRPARPLFAR